VTRPWAAAAVLTLVPLVGCGVAAEPDTEPVSQPSIAVTAEPEPTDPTTDGSGATGPEVIGTVAAGLSVPWGIDFLPDGAAVVTERDTTRVLVIDPAGAVREIGRISEAAPQGEAGLLGVAVSPDFASDRLLFFYLTTDEDNRVVRATYDGARLGSPQVVISGIPSAFIHDGGRLEFGPDGMLYVSTGEAGDPPIAQDRDSLGGKILRITPEGDPAPGNPEPDSPVWSWGHRNVQGLAFDDGGRLWASEFGANTWDELNLIEPGRNYGWPTIEGEAPGADPQFAELANPQVVWNTSQASPSGLAYHQDTLWLAALRGERLWRIDVSGEKAQRPRGFFVGDYGRLRTVVVAPDGNLWVTTSNRDGRGDPSARDDRILLVRP
jgi:glucose/arabinose dehydrogenase